MSLFDCVSSDEESVSSDSNSDLDERFLSTEHSDVCKTSQNMESSDDVRRLLGLPSRNTLLSTDISITKVGHEENCNNLRNGRSFSGFGDKIAKSLQSREKEKEEIRLKRIQEQRLIDAKDVTLIKKDKDVGIFITPAYKEVLQRNSKISASSFNSSENNIHTRQDGDNNNKSNKHNDDSEDDDEEPLGKFIRTLQNQQNAKPTSAIIDQNTSSQAQNEKLIENTECNVASNEELSNVRQDGKQCSSVDEMHDRLENNDTLSQETTNNYQKYIANVTMKPFTTNLSYHHLSDEYLDTCTANSNERITSHIQIRYEEKA